ncbi:PadR family transcriptional regulator [Candidatus Stoquefichus sp. SB1]|uniref:PadR family transcriptional regulator n=1 Tax=Candidatus Stoquefichus sp. SB1 TaxID=1658109 RepID=UPI00067EC9E9|nr:PadR family transcriptional regulator [Candidatus Stoquefichus sp. SB1]
MSRPANNFFKLEMLLLKIIDQQDCYGYQITQLISQLSNKKIEIKEGTMYPVLYRLMDNGYISDKKVLVGKRLTRVYYHIEPEGKKYLQDLYEEYLQTIDNINSIMLWEGKYDE